MRTHQPGTLILGRFLQNNRQFPALPQVPQALKLTASKVRNVVFRHELEIVRINGCKAVALKELYRYIDNREAKK